MWVWWVVWVGVGWCWGGECVFGVGVWWFVLAREI